MAAMPGRAASQAYVGRRAQLDALRQAVIDVGKERGHVVLVGGEAGIGKTRLLDEFEASVSSDSPTGRPVLVVRGTCSELAAGSLPFLPILDLLDGLVASGRATDAVSRLHADLAGGGADPSSPGTRSNTFLGFRDVVVDGAAELDLVLVVDDLHWADRSTLELMTFTAPRLGDARVMLVGAYRSDELHRRHPLRPVLIELEHAGGLAHLRLGPLSPDDVAAQLEAISGMALPASNVARIVELADGNPFYVEELAALDLEGARLPQSLRDVLAARLSRLSDPTLEVLSGAAVIGRDVERELLEAIVEISTAGVAAGLQDAVGHQVIEPTPDGRRYRFRHALLAEAVRDDLLPAERIGLHRRLAAVLTARPELRAESPATAAAEIAHHWTEAGDSGHAFPAWIEAGRSAGTAHAWRESASAYERALSLAAAGPEGNDPARRADLGMRAAMMTSFSGEPRRAYELAIEAMAADEGTDPVQSALRWADYSGIANDAGDFAQERAAADRSVELMPKEPPSRELARVLVGHVSSQMLRSAYRASVAEADEARRVCRLVGAWDAELDLVATRAQSLALLGHASDALSAAEVIISGIAGRERAATWHIGAALTNELAALVFSGEFQAAVAFDERIASYVSDLELDRAWRPWFDEIVARAMFFLGRWPEDAARLDRAEETELMGFLDWGNRIGRALLDGARGVRSSWTDVTFDPAVGPDSGMRGDLGAALALAALWEGDAAAAARLADGAVAAVIDTENVSPLAWAVSVAVRAWADRAEAARAAQRAPDLDAALQRIDELMILTGAIVAGTHLEGASATPWMVALGAASDAERLRAEGRSSAEAWHRAAATYDALGTRPSAAYARYREAEAAVSSGDRARAAAALGEAAAAASALGAVPLTAAIEGLARRARLAIPPHAADDGATHAPAADAASPSDADPWGLSTREREVLALVAEGRTNREIGDALFISDKTASVHVTHILVKLGVSSRTEAALLAARAGIAGRDA